MLTIKQAFRNVIEKIKNAKLTTRFVAFYFLLVFIPIVIFINWYTSSLIREREVEEKFEKQILLEQSATLLSNYLLHSRFVQRTLQGNAELVKLLENGYLSASDELFSYNSHIYPVFTGILSSDPVIDEIFIYRYSDSYLKHSSLIYYLLSIGEFSYDPSIPEKLKSQETYQYVAMQPSEARHRDEAAKSPKLIIFNNIYNNNYSKVLGILEVQINLDKAAKNLSLPSSGGLLYLKYDGLYYQIIREGETSYLKWNEPLASIAPGGGESAISAPVAHSGFELIYLDRVNISDINRVMENVFMAVGILIIPTFLFWFYIYLYGARLLKFSRHIRKSRDIGLTRYTQSYSKDEFGIVIEEYNRMTETINALIESVRNAEKLKNDANYYAMASQVNPHFMFNTLENIRMHIEIGQHNEASEMISSLSRFLRYNISMRRDSTLLDELEHIRHYLLIYQYRQANRIRYSISIPEDMKNIRCPFCILQPIVENCMKHGMTGISGKLNISITVKNAPKGIYVYISDNGAGMTEKEITQINRMLHKSCASEQDENGKVGLVNVNNRLKYYFGREYGISFAPNKPKGLTCIIYMGESPAEGNIAVHLDNQEEVRI